MIFCCETWERKTDTFDIDNYHCITVPRPESLNIRGKGKRGHGGICLYIRNDIRDGLTVMDKIPEGFLWVKMDKNYFSLQDDLCICFCYIPPKDSIYFRKNDCDLFDLLEKGIRHYSDFGSVAVIGDLNSRCASLSDEPVSCEGIDKYIESLSSSNFSDDELVGRRFSLDRKSDSSGARLLGICKEAGLRIVNGRLGVDKGIGEFTYQSVLGRSVIDYVLLQPDFFKYVSQFIVHDIFTFSDHAPLQLSLKMKRNLLPVSENRQIHKIVWDKDKFESFRNSLSDSLIDLDLLVDRIVHDNLNIDDGIENFSAVLYSNADRVFGKDITVKTSQTRKFKSPWFNNECEIARAEFKRVNKEYRKSKSQAIHDLLLQKRKIYSKTKRRAQAIFKQNERQRWHALATSNPKSFWQEIRRLKENKSKQSNVSLQTFYEHFSQVYSDDSNLSVEHVEAFVGNNLSGSSQANASDQNGSADSLDLPISREEVLKAISKLKRNKSAGLDLLPPELFIDSADLLCDTLCKLFNHIFSSSSYPESWTKGVLVPVPKKGDLSDANNYRGITLTSIFSKLYSHILDNRLRSWAEENNIINENQFGFRENKSTIDCLYILQAIVNRHLSKKKKLYCTFVDFKKAFDLVYRNGIWFKLCSIGASLKIVNAIKAIYNSVKVCVRSMGKVSECFDSLVGVKQGEPLSPLLFIVFLNDLAGELDINIDFDNNREFIDMFQKFILLFADDTLLLAESPTELQYMLNKLCTYCKRWNITVNTAKTKVMLFKSSNRPEQLDMYFDEILLENVRQFIYLGVNISSNGKFLQAQKHLAEQASKALFALSNIFDSTMLCIGDKIKLFESLVQPILMYGCEIWGFHKADDIEKVHVKFLKQILGVRRQTSNIAVYGEVGRVPLSVLRKVRILKYWYKILSSRDTLLFKVYSQQVNSLMQGATENNWVLQLKTLLNELGFTYLWNSQSMTKLQLQMVSQCIYDQYFQSWYSAVNTTSKLETLKCLNKVFNFEKYLTCIKIDSHRVALTRFRCSAHKLMIEEGRHRNVEKYYRLCQICNINVIEDEYHFLLVCPAYRDIRVNTLPKYFCSWPSKQKFVKLLTETQAATLKKIGKFLYLANEKRKTLLNL